MIPFSSFLPARALVRLGWLNLPGAVLLTLLQRTPVLRTAAALSDVVTASPVGAVLRSAIATVGSLGVVQAMAGATQFVLNRPSPVNDTVGVPIAPVFFTYTGTPAAPASFRITGELPPGLTFIPSPTSANIINSSTPRVTGTPTVAGTYTIRVQGYNNVNGTGETNNEFEPIVFSIAAGAAVAPTITAQPISQSVSVGASVTFSVAFAGSPTPDLTWRRNGVALAGATAATLTLPNVQIGQAGDYSVTLTNQAGAVTSNPATLTVTSVDTQARLSNLSVRTAMAANQTLIVGGVVNDGSRHILVRAVGPTLAAFGLTDYMTDPSVELFIGSDVVLSNNDWEPGLAPTFSQVGAFGFTAASKDAAFLRELIGAYSIQVRGTGPGIVLVEAYDSGAPSAARLINVSARNRVGTDDNIMIAGFSIDGGGSKQLLIRAVGPKLSAFGVGGFLRDPKLEIYNSANVKVAENDNWTSSLAGTFLGVGAFSLDFGSLDAALVTTLPRGSYTVQVRGADGGTGEALIELYEVR